MSPTAFAICAHPDDIEFMMAGTLLHLGAAGFDLHYMTMADGACGSMTMDGPTTARVRGAEACAAAAVAGATYHPPLCADLEIVYSVDLLRRLASIVRSVAPAIILTHPPLDYMEDHMNTCRLVLTAAFARGMPNFAVLPHVAPTNQPVAIYHALPYGLHNPMGHPAKCDFYVDISAQMERKREMLACHRSQKEWLDASQGIDSYLTHMEALSSAMGQRSERFVYAEGWSRHLPLGYSDPTFDPLRDTLDKLIVDDEMIPF
jgi:LmbE family N-acetylglucosaminyl deacetylase